MIKRIFYIGFLAFGWSLGAQTLQVGGHVGALGATSGPSEIGYGLNLTANPYNFAGFRMDLSFAGMEGGTYFSTGPALVFYPVDFDEMKLGALIGAGFHRFPGDKTRFAINYGMLGDFSLTEMISVGFDTRYHGLFDVDNIWTVFLTLGFRFELEGAW